MIFQIIGLDMQIGNKEIAIRKS